MDTESLDIAPRNPRHETAATARLKMDVQWQSASAGGACDAQLVDLSRCGFQLRVPVSLQPQVTIAAHLQDETGGLQLDLSGQICWCREDGHGHWLVGCQSDRELDWETMGELFLNEILVMD